MTEHLMVGDWPQPTDGSTGVRFFVCTCGFRGFNWAAHVALHSQFDLMKPGRSATPGVSS